MTDPQDTLPFRDLAKQVVQHCGGKAIVSWDDRFDAVVVQVKASQAQSLEQSVVETLAVEVWNPGTLPDAPARVQAIADIFGGLDDDQKLFVTDPVESSSLVVAWWPWRDGKNLSLRLLLHSDRNGPDGMSFVLKSWFDMA